MTDIYDMGYNKLLNKEIPDNSTGVVYDTVQNAINAGSVLSGGSLNLKSLSIGGLVRQVAPGDDIQQAIDSISEQGGGTVQLLAKTYLLHSNIILKKDVALTGASRDTTIIDFEGRSLNISVAGTVSSDVTNFSLSNMTVQNSSATHAVSITRASYFSVANVHSTSSSSNGFMFHLTDNCLLSNLLSTTNSGAGYYFNTDSGKSVNILALNLIAKTNTLDGFTVGSLSAVTNSTFIGCVAGGTIVGEENEGNGFTIHAYQSAFVGCHSLGNTGDGFEVNSNGGALFVACFSDSNDASQWDINIANTVVVACSGYTNDAIGPEVDVGSGGVVSIGNINMSQVDNGKMYKETNGSGQTLRAGNVVVRKATANGDAFTTTTINGDNKVLGVVFEASLSNEYTDILAEGYTDNIYVSNGTASIVIGDWLSTWSHAYYAKKAATGDMVFAMALATPTTSTASIAALLVSPRLI